MNAAVTAPLPLQIGEQDALLIWDLVRGVSKPADVLKRYAMTKPDFEAKARQPQFSAAFLEAKRFWDSDANVHVRIKLKSAALLEDSLTQIAVIVTGSEMSASAKLDAVEKLAKLSDSWEVAKRKDGAIGEAQKVSITINLGDKPSERVAINAEVIPVEQPADE